MTLHPSAKADPTTEEVRVAMVLNGGVSLAVWMGGCVAELDCARRAHIDPAGIGDSYGGIYHALCKAFSRELVVDIMCGSSAGGINGAMLAAAIVRQGWIDPSYLRKRWIELADFSKLLQPLETRGPHAIMRGDYFHGQLLETFEVLLGTTQDETKNQLLELPEEKRPKLLLPVLNVTTTDLTGSELEFRDTWGEKLAAREYRACFKFRRDGDFTAQNLASASRASASFPVAFEPWEVTGNGPCQLAGFKGSRWVVDGGLLDNAPIRLALDAIPRRPAARQVKRFVCYVNPEPPELLEDEEQAEPTLARVIGAVVNLPRKAPFADQLQALQRASHEWVLNENAEIPLLKLDRECLVNAADALLLTYRRRRRLHSAIDLLEQPAAATAVFNRLEDKYELPWIPESMETPRQSSWRWGILAALRVHHLMLDLVGRAVDDQSERAVRESLLVARKEIYERVSELRRRQAAFSTDPCVIRRLEAIADPTNDLEEELKALAAYTWARNSSVYESIRETALTMSRIVPLLDDRDGIEIGVALFDEQTSDGAVSDVMLERFLERVLSIEVIRRAFSAEDEVNRAQPIEFAQLTPYAPTPLLSPKPFSGENRMTPERKLAGLVLGHFGGFYRRSWRANDFMWGRLDSAVRIVALLIDTERASETAAQDIAGVLLDRVGGQAWLLEEVLREAQQLDDEQVNLDRDDLRNQLTRALDSDLKKDGELMRVLCALVAQLEILRAELPVVVAEAATDEGAGASPNELALPNKTELSDAEERAAIESLREEPSLPRRLGVGSAEERTSDLAMRTISRTGLVVLSVLRRSAPFSMPLQLMRAPVLPVTGVVARNWYNRLAVLAAFWAAAMALTVGFVTTEDKAADLNHLSLPTLLLRLIALLVVLGTVVLPAYRLVRGGKVGAVMQFGWATALVGTGLGAGLVLATRTGGLSLAQLAVQPGGAKVEASVLVPVTAVVFGSVPIARLLRSRVEKLAEAAWSRFFLVLSFGAAGAVGVWAAKLLIHTIAHGVDWQVWAAFIALVGAPLAAAAYLFLRTPVDRLWRSRG